MHKHRYIQVTAERSERLAALGTEKGVHKRADCIITHRTLSHRLNIQE
jgi:hypothetical protein